MARDTTPLAKLRRKTQYWSQNRRRPWSKSEWEYADFIANIWWSAFTLQWLSIGVAYLHGKE